MTPLPDDKPGPPSHPDHDRFERELDKEKAKLERLDAPVENLIVVFQYELDARHGNHLQTEIRQWAEDLLLRARTLRTKLLQPRIESIEADISLLEEVKTREGVLGQDIDLEDEFPPEVPPVPKSPKPPKDGGKPNGGKKK